MKGSYESLVVRVRGEYREMPGLCLTIEQASRLWQVDPSLCETGLSELVLLGILQRTPSGAYVAASLTSELSRRR